MIIPRTDQRLPPPSISQRTTTAHEPARPAKSPGPGGISLRWSDAAAFAQQTPGHGSETPRDTVIYAIGDIHGNLDLLEALQSELLLDFQRRRARRRVIVYLGDYPSRGSRSRQVVERVRTWRPPGYGEVEMVPLKGNHEDMALRFLGGEFGLGRHWLESGGMSTLLSYGVEPVPTGTLDRETMETLRGRFARALPPEHLAFLQSLKTSHREGGYYFVHAGVRPGVALSEQCDHDRMWIKHDFLSSEVDHGAVVVHGHMVVPEPEQHPNRIAIDTGAHQSGILTCLVLEGGKRSLLQTAR